LSQDQRSIKNETPKKALGDIQWNPRVRRQFPETETRHPEIFPREPSQGRADTFVPRGECIKRIITPLAVVQQRPL
jgi:hypothetical protein